MLHILLLILKVIGIIIAVILGILVLLLCIVLSVPVRYEIKAAFDGKISTAKAMADVTWFLHLIRVSAQYSNGRPAWRVKIAWKTILSSHKEKNKDVKENLAEDLDVEQELAEKEVETDEEDPWIDEKTDEENPEIQKTIQAEVQKEPEKVNKDVAEKQPEVQKEPEKEREKELEILEEKDNPKRLGILEKLKDIYQKIKYTIHSICDRIKALSEKKDKILEVISDETHKKAFAKAKEEAFRLIKRLWPKRIKADIKYGFDDPSITGRVLAAYSMFYPFVGDQVHITPDFEHAVIEGRLYIKGKVRAFTFVRTAWNLFWCKAVRQTYHDIREFEL